MKTAISMNACPILLAASLFLVAIPPSGAQSGHIQLLTVAETPNGEVGGLADLYLDVRPGSGAIFIDSYPLTRIDTQISTRYANEIACDLIQEDCTKYDFFYTIRASSSVVGGPSAGAPIAALTASVLGGLALAKDTIMTGTITSGGVIGPVAGVPEKAAAAAEGGYRRILIPAPDFEENATNASRFANLSIEVVRIHTLHEALTHLTGRNFSDSVPEPSPDPTYARIMADIAGRLCNRTDELSNTTPLNESVLNFTESRREAAWNASAANASYSAASFCFTANLRLRRAALEAAPADQLAALYTQTEEAVGKYNARLEKIALTSLPDLETYMIVKERLIEAVDVLKETTPQNATPADAAYALERYYSGVVWGSFFEMSQPSLVLHTEHLRTSCLTKLAEAEERLNYVDLYVPTLEAGVRRSMSYAREDYERGRYALCLFKASKAKAEANALIAGLGTPPEAVGAVVSHKLDAVRQLLARQRSKAVFPILGYSYYEYARALLEDEPYSALTFAEYALELGNLDVYFPRPAKKDIVPFDLDVMVAFGGGVLSGILATLVVLLARRARRRKPDRSEPTRF